ncbi:cellulase family glycosylhydrolase [Agriterribacter sp.]|uniref:glycoside hydrolase family 5 protein n=1 Tax=Agriterribacter sp. TaxID=2821509 RepID=UPI002C6D8AF1|nr:cellulase family glycosylhydrolase [Agriterribacter sp.]HRP57052.1 cellulase family glycosylhydrolase [Agriterribacter sp.]
MKRIDPKILVWWTLLFFCSLSVVTAQNDIRYDSLPRWRGFNLLEKIDANNNQPFREKDFMLINRLGFNFVRLPMSYECWFRGDKKYDHKTLLEIDEAINWGKKYKIHISLNIHKAPGYWVNTPEQKPNLFDDDKMLSQFVEQWVMFAKRYKGLNSQLLSFDLLNEPITTDTKYIKMVKAAVEAIRKIDPGRLIIADGNGCGRNVVKELAALEVAQSGRGYDPVYVTHYKCSWVGEEYGNATVPPTWPYVDKRGKIWDVKAIREMYRPWIELKDSGVGVHIGEMGVNRFTPHDVTLKYIESVLSVLKEHDIGFAFWDFRGGSGFFNSEREDVEYEDYEGLKLDRKMLELIQRY